MDRTAAAAAALRRCGGGPAAQRLLHGRQTSGSCRCRRTAQGVAMEPAGLPSPLLLLLVSLPVLVPALQTERLTLLMPKVLPPHVSLSRDRSDAGSGGFPQ